MLPFEYEQFMRNVKLAVRRGLISEERLNDAVTRILRAKFAAGLFDYPVKANSTEVGSEEHRSLARQAVAASLVLLKNQGNALPIRNSVNSIRVAGSAADNVGRQAGAWTVEWQGVDGNWLPNSTSILEGIRQRAHVGVKIEFSQDGVFAPGTVADIGIAVVGETPYAEGWGDNELPILSEEDREAIRNLRKTSRQLVVIIVSGRPLLIANEVKNIDALVAAWLPGSEGGGVADVLFGAVPFSGTLPIAWPLTSQQIPVSVFGETADGTSVLFKRGFGLR
jgi:beta-glucosidase